MNNNTPEINISSTTENSLEPIEASSPDFQYVFRQSWIQELGFKGAVLFSIIEGLSSKKGYFYGSNELLAAKCNIKVSNVERGLKYLEDKGWIFRNSYSITKGSKRDIVTKSRALDYWKNVLDKPQKNADVKLKFIEYMKGNISINSYTVNSCMDPQK